ncbi:MAG: S-layer homology domain-containing protein [Clostridiales bacterium]|jgi:hypothetical protein|nr:S-layer homology domain-containing protein [Clostridiales bacterium]
MKKCGVLSVLLVATLLTGCYNYSGNVKLSENQEPTASVTVIFQNTEWADSVTMDNEEVNRLKSYGISINEFIADDFLNGASSSGITATGTIENIRRAKPTGSEYGDYVFNFVLPFIDNIRITDGFLVLSVNNEPFPDLNMDPPPQISVDFDIAGTVKEFNGDVTIKDGRPSVEINDKFTSAYIKWEVSADFIKNNSKFFATGDAPPAPSTSDAPTQARTFPDVKSTDWFYTPVMSMNYRGFINGDDWGNFNPQSSVTRADFLIMVMRTYEITNDSSAVENFADVSASAYYAPYLATAKKLQLVSGMGHDEFYPTASISRQDMCVMLHNILRQKDVPLFPNTENRTFLEDFPDSYKVADYATEAMALLVDCGIISGMDGSLSPAENCTRAQSAQVLYNLLEYN